MNLIDIAIILLLILGVIVGFKKGFIKSSVTLVGTILVIVIAWQLKNPLSAFMYKYLPFMNLSGDWAGITVINILIYEAIAFLIIVLLLSIILRILIKISGLTEKILRLTVILSIPSKLLGAILGLVEMYLFIFVGALILNQVAFNNEIVAESKYIPLIIDKTPFVSEFVKENFEVIEDIKKLPDIHGIENKEVINEEALKLLLKYNIITPENAEILDERGKMNVDGALNIIEDYYENREELQ